MAKKEGAEVSIIDEREVVTYPVPDKPVYTILVTYRHDAPVPRTIFINLSDVATGREPELRKQIQRKEGDLYKVYLTHRAKRIKEDIEAASAFKPETVRL